MASRRGSSISITAPSMGATRSSPTRDAGYAAAAITQGLEDRNIYGVIGYRTATHRDGYFYSYLPIYA